MLVCICEDEAICRCQLKKILEEYSFAQDIDVIITEYSSPQQLFENADFEIIFLDISFEGKNVGVKAARDLRIAGNRSVIIFLTAFPDFSLEGYEAEAFRYILKPITTEKIYPVLDAVFYKWENDGRHIQIKSTDGFVYMDCGKIVTIEIRGRKRIIIYNQETIETWETLRDIRDKLPQIGFAHTDQSTIVNLKYVDRILPNEVSLVDCRVIPLARRYKRDFILAMDKYINATHK